MEIKYDAVFGDYRFANSTCEIAMQSSFGEIIEMTFTQPIVIPEGWGMIAMRRIIRTPTWTVDDLKSGKLPEVGSKAVSVNDFCVVEVLAVRNRCVVVCNSDVIDSRPCVFTVDNFLGIFKPIESPEEKAARLMEEWVELAIYETVKLKGTTNDEHERLKARLGDVYNALLSGDLPVPVKGE